MNTKRNSGRIPEDPKFNSERNPAKVSPRTSRKISGETQEGVTKKWKKFSGKSRGELWDQIRENK